MELNKQSIARKENDIAVAKDIVKLSFRKKSK